VGSVVVHFQVDVKSAGKTRVDVVEKPQELLSLNEELTRQSIQRLQRHFAFHNLHAVTTYANVRDFFAFAAGTDE